MAPSLLGGLAVMLAAAGHTLGATLGTRQNSQNVASVDLSLSARRGKPAHLASGILYGIPDDPTQIPDHFYTDIGFNYARIGGAQLAAGGWVDGLDAYYARFNNTRDNYHEARRFGAKVIILPHDIWGTDHATSTTNWPGDNGDWTDYYKYLDQLTGDLVKNNMLDGLIYDTWNEPDGSFWARSEAQYLELWTRTFWYIRNNTAFSNVRISGPSSAGQPSNFNSWWTTFATHVVADGTIPDQYVWHDEPGDFAFDYANFLQLRQKYGLPEREININEYGTFDQQISSGAAWWISRLERYDSPGLRGNWLSGCQLRDFLASLLTKPDQNSCSAGDYSGNGEYQVYKYYNMNMTGERVTTTSSGDGKLDVFSTVDTGKARVLVGVVSGTGTWYVTINGLSGIGLPTSGSLPVQTWGFNDNGHFGAVAGPVDLGVYAHDYSGDSVTFPIYQVTAGTAYAFEFAASNNAAASSTALASAAATSAAAASARPRSHRRPRLG